MQPEAFSAEAWTWLGHSYAFVSVNYHGSITFGREAQKSNQGALGAVEIDDLVAARDWVVAEGVARPDQVLATGRSCGGCPTLQAMGRRPEPWAGGISIGAIADYALMYEDQAHTNLGAQSSFFGGPPEAARVVSPITYVQPFAGPC